MSTYRPFLPWGRQGGRVCSLLSQVAIETTAKSFWTIGFSRAYIYFLEKQVWIYEDLAVAEHDLPTSCVTLVGRFSAVSIQLWLNIGLTRNKERDGGTEVKITACVSFVMFETKILMDLRNSQMECFLSLYLSNNLKLQPKRVPQVWDPWLPRLSLTSTWTNWRTCQ